jgi:hypothetical protein
VTPPPSGADHAATLVTLAQERARAQQAVVQEGRAQRALEDLLTLAQDEWALLRAEDTSRSALARAEQNVARLLRRTAQQRARTYAAQQRLDDAIFRREMEAHLQQRAQALTAALLREYGNLGPQYAVLVERTVRAEIEAERLDLMGPPADARARAAATRAVLDAVQALQQYTEVHQLALVDRQVRAAQLGLLRQFEAILAPEHPELWLEVIQRLRAAVEADHG